jgi:hypothetical protein
VASRTLVGRERGKGAGGRLVTGMVILVTADVVGGAVAVLVNANTLREAWSSKAVLAAPWPMIVAQVGLTWGAVSRSGRSARVAAGLLGVACAVSAISGFFDGQLGREDLPAAVVAGQWVFVTVTAGVGVLGFARVVELRRSLERA